MTKKELKACIRADKERNANGAGIVYGLIAAFSKNPRLLRWKFLKSYRLSEYHKGLLKKYYLRKKNYYGGMLGYEFLTGCRIGPGLQLCHGGPVIINEHAVLGSNVTIRGCCCIGNDGIDSGAPVIGDDVELGFGATVIGAVHIPNGCWIASGAVVTKSFEEEHIVIGGVPAKKIKERAS